MTGTNETKVTIVVVNWNGLEVTRPCLESLRSVSYPNVEVIVVDNGSTDGSVEAIRDLPGVRLLTSPTNLGFGRACNWAIRETDGEYVLLLNNDTVLDRPAVLETAVAFMEARPDAGALGVRLRNADGSVQISCGRFFRISAALRNSIPARLILGRARDRLWYTEAEHEETRVVDWVMGAFLFVRRSALQDVGLLDESRLLYYEDYDLCYRLRRRGWRTYFLASTSIMHRFNWSGSRAFSDHDRAMRVSRAERAVLARHRGLAYAWAYQLIAVIDRWSRAVASRLRGQRDAAERLRAETRARARALLP